MDELTMEQIERITTETILGLTPSIHGPEADETRKRVEAEMQEAAANGYVLQLPSEWPENLDERTASRAMIKAGPSCGANAPGGGGFQPGNTCAEESQLPQHAGSPRPGRQEGGHVSAERIGGLYDKVVRDGGFTYQPMLDMVPTDGFALSIFPQDERVIDNIQAMTAHTVADYINHNFPRFSDEKVHVGAWHDRDGDGKVYLDLISVLHTDEAEAAKVARRYGQLGMYNLRTHEVVTTMTPEEREAWQRAHQEMTKGDVMSEQSPNAIIVAVPKTRAEIAELSILIFERLTGRAATEQEKQEVRNREWSNIPE